MSYKRLSGWEPRTVYEYDESGRVIASRPEPEWDDVEVGWMLALQDYRDTTLCPCGCGWPAEISQDPMTEFRVRVSSVRCHVRTQMSRAQAEYREQSGARPDGLLWRAEYTGAD